MQYIKQRKEKIAVIGIASRFPKAPTHHIFWENLVNGKECLEINGNSSFGSISDIEMFDNEFFNVSAVNAKIMDPQHRMLYEAVYHLFEDAGIVPEKVRNGVGVFLGCGKNIYFLRNILSNTSIDDLKDYLSISINNDVDFLSTKISYAFGFMGPSVAMATACSTSLVTINYACQSILTGECKLAIAGGINLKLPQNENSDVGKSGYLSIDGHCRPFDNGASGTIGGNGYGVVLLKDLDSAIKDGDHIYAVIRGRGINNDGKEKVGFTAPNSYAQVRAIHDAFKMSNFKPKDIDFIETHGTGTKLGDPLEIDALRSIFISRNKKKVSLGSVKANIGHLDAASGVAGFIKAVLMAKYKVIPPQINFHTFNESIDLENLPFEISTKKILSNKGLKIGISSFGMGGTNVHLHIESHLKKQIQSANKKEHNLFILSAKRKEDLVVKIRDLNAFLRRDNDINPRSLAKTLIMGRESFEYRTFFVDRSIRDLKLRLNKDVKITNGKVASDSLFICIFSNGSKEYFRALNQLLKNNEDYKKIFDSTNGSRVKVNNQAIDRKYSLQFLLNASLFEYLKQRIDGNISLAGTNLGEIQCLYFQNKRCLDKIVNFLKSIDGYKYSQALENKIIQFISDGLIFEKGLTGQAHYLSSGFTVINGVAQRNDIRSIKDFLKSDNRYKLAVSFSNRKYEFDESGKIKFIGNIRSKKDCLTLVGSLWASGFDLICNESSEKDPAEKISLPVYPFKKIKHWTEPDPLKVIRSDYLSGPNAYYPTLTQLPQSSLEHGLPKQMCKYIVLNKCTRNCDPIINSLSNTGYDVDIDFTNPNILQRIEGLRTGRINLLYFLDIKQIFLSSENFLVSYEKIIQDLRSTFNLVKSKIIRLFIIIDCDSVNESNLPLKALALVISKEHPNIQVKIIFLKNTDSESFNYQFLSNILNTINHSPWLVFDGRNCLIPSFEKVDIENKFSLNFLNQEGTIVVFGGLGKVGFHLVKYLLHNSLRQIIIVGKTKLNIPSNSLDKNSVFEDKASEDKTIKLEYLLKNHRNLIYQSVDVTNKDSVINFAHFLKDQNIKITDIIYAVGNTNETIIDSFLASRKSISLEFFKQKVDGLSNIIKYLVLDSVNYISIFSSISSYIGGKGHFGYSTVNQYQDYIIEKLISDSKKLKILGINWDNWGNENTSKEAKELLNPQEAISTYINLLDRGFCGQFVISNKSFDNYYRKAFSFENDQFYAQYLTDNQFVNSKQSPTIDTKLLNCLLSEVLGNKSANIAKSFNENGGDSLLALEFLSNLRKVGILLSPQELLQDESMLNIIAKSNKCRKVIEKANINYDHVNLLPSQEWYIDNLNLKPKDVFNQVFVFKVNSDFSIDDIIKRLKNVIRSIESLQFELNYKERKLVKLPLDQLFLSNIAISNITDECVDIDSIIGDADEKLILQQKKLYKFDLLNCMKSGVRYICLTINRLILDGKSTDFLLRIIMDNFSAVNRKENNITDLSYSTYYAHFNEQKWLRDEVEYWRKINRSIPHYSYATKTDMVNTNLSKRLEYFKFKDRRMGIDERRMFSREVVYLARICKVFETVFHHTSICFDIAKHGRDIVFDDSTSLERLIGRFDVRFPMYIDFKSFNGNFDRHDLLDQLLKEVPVNGLNYQKIKSELKDEFNAYLSPQILFNFLGTINKPVTKYTNISLVKTGTSSILKFNRNYEFEFHIWVDNNEVFLRFEYSKSRVDNLIIKNISDGLNLEFAKNPS